MKLSNESVPWQNQTRKDLCGCCARAITRTLLDGSIDIAHRGWWPCDMHRRVGRRPPRWLLLAGEQIG